uniref:Uncharacterized protein n=1 Tax=Arundo donax TaxID=35708 RepID=A0A0A9HPD6_ARUDO
MAKVLNFLVKNHGPLILSAPNFEQLPDLRMQFLQITQSSFSFCSCMPGSAQMHEQFSILMCLNEMY